MTRPIVSFIVPFYLCDEYLIDAIDSIVSQTYENWEVIVVDDCSPGAAAQDIIRGRYGKNVKVFRNARNRGPSAARNAAVAQSSGEFIVPLDADDMLRPQYLQVTLDALIGSAYGGAYTDLEVAGHPEVVHKVDCSMSAIMCARGGCTTFLYRRDVFDSIGGYNTNLWMAEDKDFWLSAFERGWKFLHISEPLFLYRNRKGSLSDGIEACGEAIMLQLFREHRQLYLDRIDEWFPVRERLLWQGARHYDELYKQWEIDAANYRSLEAGYWQLHAEWAKKSAYCEELEKRYQDALSVKSHGLMRQLTQVVKASLRGARWQARDNRT